MNEQTPVLDNYTLPSADRLTVQHTTARTQYKNILPNTSVREQFTRTDYDYFRPGEFVSDESKMLMQSASNAYRNNSIIKNVIDLMADFASQGIDLVHPVKRHDKLCKAWARQVNLRGVAERFLNYIYRFGNTVLVRSFAKIGPELKKSWYKTAASTKPDLTKIDVEQVEPDLVPWSYTFLNPITVEVVNKEAAEAGAAPRLGIRLNNKVIAAIKDNKDVDNIPPYLLNTVKKAGKGKNNGVVELPADRVYVGHYKKDDWEIWARPMIAAMLDDIANLEKMRLADLSALDGIISSVRLWNIGNIDKNIWPSEAAINKLHDVLLTNSGGGPFDVIWGPDLKFTETGSEGVRFLGQEKYIPVLNAIYGGLGIPPTLTGTAQPSGYTNNVISLKTLVERLKYGRDLLVAFIQAEANRFAMAMGLVKMPRIKFDRMTFTDEATEKNLLIQLADRNIISWETILERFGEMPEIEYTRLRREGNLRVKGKLPDKASPYHNPNQDSDLEKIALQRGIVTLDQLGFPYKQVEVEEEEYDPVLTPQDGGRPPGTKDKQKRKQRQPKPRGLNLKTPKTAALINWASNTFNTIGKFISDGFLNKVGKENIRMLTNEESDKLEHMKFAVMCNIKPFSSVDKQTVSKVMSGKLSIDSEVLDTYKDMVSNYMEIFEKAPTIADDRQIKILVYSSIWMDK